MAIINNNNVQKYIDKGLINPYLVKIDLNVTKTANDNVHRWVTLADAIKGGYKFNFDYDINDKPTEAPTLPEVTVTAPKKMYSVGAGEMRPFNSVRQASEYAQQHPKKDASESALNWLLAGMIAAPAATTIGTAGYIGDRLFHDAVQAYNGEDIDKNGMWVYNPGGWITGTGVTKIPQATKALYSFGRTNIGTKGSRLSYVLDKNLGNLEVPKTLDFGGIKRFKWGDAEFDNPNLYYHIDKGNYKGWHQGKIKGGYLKQGYFYPGDSPNTEQIAYSWWNKGNPYTYGNAWKRLIISAEKPQFIHVRSQPYKIGQWNPSSKKSFVTNSEYVASQPVKISPDQVFYFDKYRNGWYRSPARMRYIFGERPSTITTAERMGIPKSERHLRTHGKREGPRNFKRSNIDIRQSLVNQYNTNKYIRLLGKAKDSDQFKGSIKDRSIVTRPFAEYLEKLGINSSLFTEKDLNTLIQMRSKLVQRTIPQTGRSAISYEMKPRNQQTLFSIDIYENGSTLGEISARSNIPNRPGANEVPIDMIQRVDGVQSKGLSEDAYNAAIDYIHQTNIGEGLVSGDRLLSPEITYNVWKHYPNRQLLRTNGHHTFGTGRDVVGQPVSETHKGPVVMLTEPSKTPLPMKSNSIFHPDMIKDGKLLPPDWTKYGIYYSLPLLLGTYGMFTNKKAN